MLSCGPIKTCARTSHAALNSAYDDPQVLYLIFNRIKSGAQTAIYNSMDGKALEIDKSDAYNDRVLLGLYMKVFFVIVSSFKCAYLQRIGVNRLGFEREVI